MQKKLFNEEHSKEISLLAQKYTVGMSMAAKRHGLKPDCLDACSDRFVQGEFDKEIKRTTQPAVVGPICSWVRELKFEESKKAEKDEQQALDAQAAAQVQALQNVDGRASTPGGGGEADQVDNQSGKDEAFRGAVLSVAKAHFHALKSLNVEVQGICELACLLAAESPQAAQQQHADQHFSLLECIKKDETHELVMRNEWHTQTAVPGVTWCDLNHMLPDDVLSGSKDFTKEHARTLQNLLRSVTTQRAVVVLCPSGSVAVGIETFVQEHILNCTDFALSRVTVLFQEDNGSRAYGSAALLFLTTNLYSNLAQSWPCPHKSYPKSFPPSGQSRARGRALMPRRSGRKTKRAAGQSTQTHFTKKCLLDWVCRAAFRSQKSMQGVGRCLLRLSMRSCISQGRPGHHGLGLATYQQKRQRGCSTSKKQLASLVKSFSSRMRSRRLSQQEQHSGDDSDCDSDNQNNQELPQR